MTEKIRPKNRILNYTAVIVGIILCVGLVTVVTHADSLDKVVLLEDRNPGYWEYLSPEHVQVLYTSDPDTINLLISSLQSTDAGSTYHGFEIKVNPDKSVTIDGVNNEEDVHIAYEWTHLNNDTYQLSDGGVNTTGAYSYVYSNGDTLASLPNNSIFTADDAHNEDGYSIGVVVFKGNEIHETFYPMLTIAGENVSFQPYMTTYQISNSDKSVALYDDVPASEIADSDMRIWKKSWKQVEDKDNRIWASILYTDGTGVQYRNGEIFEGSIDRLGRVDNQ